jgi:drug/metabolite transporter (DMT)-like permease
VRAEVIPRKLPKAGQPWRTVLRLLSLEMNSYDNAIVADRKALLLALLGILGFSGTLPATRLAVRELDPWLVAIVRALVAGGLAAPCLLCRGEPRPALRQLPSLAVVALGTVIGFPLLSALALTRVPASDAAMVVAFVPTLTALGGVLRNGERPAPLFWVCSLAGLGAVLAFLGGGGGQLHREHALLLLASVVCALGYTEAARLARQKSGLWVVSWALLLALPALVPLLFLTVHALPRVVHPSAWLGLGYVSVVSMFLAFVPWYAALARGGVGRMSQLQLLQPLLSVCWSGWLLAERLSPRLWLTLGVVLTSIALSRRLTRPALAPARTL